MGGSRVFIIWRLKPGIKSFSDWQDNDKVKKV
jgi:hypothetical protein